MAIISFWSEDRKDSAQTLSMVAIATYMAIEHNARVLIVDATFDDDTILMTKKMLVNAQYKIADQPSHGMGSILKDINNETDSSLEEKIEKINNITKEELILASKELKLDTIYFLEGTK